MTFCLGMTVKDGLVGIADTRVTMGSECITAKKLVVYERPGLSFFVMTAGLRSVRDKAVTYFEDALDTEHASLDRLFKVVNLFAQQLRHVMDEDKESLKNNGLDFRFSALIGGQVGRDPTHKLFLLYAEGNWVEISPGTPYSIIGATGYGKPILDRTFHFEDPLQLALKVGALAFDSTRISAADVDFPIDIVIYRRGSFHMVERRFAAEDLSAMTSWWQDRLRGSIEALPSDKLNELLKSSENP